MLVANVRGRGRVGPSVRVDAAASPYDRGRLRESRAGIRPTWGRDRWFASIVAPVGRPEVVPNVTISRHMTPEVTVVVAPYGLIRAAIKASRCARRSENP